MPQKVDRCVEKVLDKNPELDEENAFAICNASIKGEYKADGYAVQDLSNLGVKAEEFNEICTETKWEPITEGSWVHHDGEMLLYDKQWIEGFVPKGEFEGYTIGTEGDPGEEESFTAFMDAIADIGDAWQVRNGELYTWPEDSDDFPRHDPVIKIIGVPQEEFDSILDRFNVEFMNISEGL